jgi:tetratricopeptide (TPR) repeat protein
VGFVNEQSEHLSNAQIENYGNRSSGAGPDADQNDEARINAHLAACPSCRNHLLDFHRANFGLLADPQLLLDLQVNTASTPDCLSEDDLRQLAAGLLPGAVGVKLTLHAAACGRCGQLLRIYTELYSDDFSPEEQAVLGQLKSASPDWAEQTAQKMLRTAAASTSATAVSAASSSPDSRASDVSGTSSSFAAKLRRFLSSKWTLVPAIAATFSIAFGFWYSYVRITPEKVQMLLAQAYTENRNLEMRIPYAKHSDFHQVRGDTGSLLNLPDSYREASVPIASNLKKHPDNPAWLLLSARFDLLHWDYKSAFSTLERIEDPKTIESSEARLTRALALYEKAEVENQQSGRLYAEIVELMGKTLQKNPDDSAALFNQAIACEKSHMYECAIGDYKHLLDIEKDRGWAGEANQHLRNLQEKKNLSQ